MKISISRGFRQQHSILRPQNTGMSVFAKNRVEQVVGIQNEKHIEALKVQGTDLSIWLRGYSGQKCSCGCDSSPSITNQDKMEFSDPLSITMVTDRSQYQDQNEPPQSYQNPLDDFETDEEILDSLKYSIGDENDLVFGGDKTPCGICLGTGYKDGYQMYNGSRIVLDYWDNPTSNGFLIRDTHPYSYQADFDDANYITWKVELPTFFKQFIGLRVRNNIETCRGYSVKISFDGITYVDYSDRQIIDRNGTPTVAFIKIIPNLKQLAKSEKFEITHIELYFQLGDFIKGDFAPISNTENFEFFEALQTTSLELAGDVAGIDREAVILDRKNHRLWKVVSVTPHLTEARQIFKSELDLRMIQPSENLYLLNLLTNPYTILNYRGLEQKQNLQTYFGEYTPSH